MRIVTVRGALPQRLTDLAVLAVCLFVCSACTDVADAPDAAVAAEARATSAAAPLPTLNAPSTRPDPIHGERPGALPAAAPAESPRDVERLTGARTRVVWTQDAGDGTDFNSVGGRLVLMGLDSGDGHGERPILAALSNYAKPLLTPAGDRVVFSNRHEQHVFIVNWDGTGVRPLASGFALEVWRDPTSGIEWVYVGSDEADTRAISYRQVRRYRLDAPGTGELVWDQSPISEDNFQLSVDGRSASGVFPWPDVGLADMTHQSWHKLGEGCWTALSPGSPSLLWYFDGAHRNLTLVDADRDERWRIRINDAAGVDGFEVYHPRWSNDARFLTMTGPYTVGDADNKIRRGGSRVEVYLGRFSRDFRTVETWMQVTDNGRADFYPDAWIDPRGGNRPTLAGDVGPTAGTSVTNRTGRRGVTDPAARVVLAATVVENVPVPSPDAIAPYRQALLAVTYRVDQVLEGAYPLDRVVASHWVIRDGAVLPAAARPKDERYRLTLELYDDHPELEGQRLVIDVDDVTLPLYYDTSSLP